MIHLLEKKIGIFDTCFPFNNVKGRELNKTLQSLGSLGIIEIIKPKEQAVQKTPEISLKW